MSSERATWGTGDYVYCIVEHRTKWPDDWQLGDVAAVGINDHMGPTAPSISPISLQSTAGAGG